MGTRQSSGADQAPSGPITVDAAGRPVLVIGQQERKEPSSIVVMKFGGTSVADGPCIKRVAKRIVDTHEAGHPVVAVVSARGDTTDDLIALAGEITDRPRAREMDMLLSAGERISAALVTMAIHVLGHDAISLSGPQAGILTDNVHSRAKIVDIKPDRIKKALEQGKIVLVAGFQGLSTDNDVTTLGRGGSDATAVALAAALNAEVCEIYTDVDGVYTADPRLVPSARKLKRVSFEEMLEMAATGAKVLMLRCVEFGRRYGVPIHVRSSFTDVPGTWVTEEGEQMEQAIVSGVTYALEDAKVTISNLPDQPGVAARIFTALAKAGVNVDMIIQNVSEKGITDISFTAGEEDLATIRTTIEALRPEITFDGITTDNAMAKLSLIGAGMKSHPGVAAKMFETLAQNGINIEMISTSSIKISCVIRREAIPTAVNALHEAFNLGVELVRRDEESD